MADGRLRGTHDSVSGGGLKQNIINQNQIAWWSWARFHDIHPRGMDIAVDPEQIVLVEREETTVDERDMFTDEDIQTMREQCRNKRERALLELLIYTGQRHNALRNLRVRNIEPERGESGVLHVPDEQGKRAQRGKRSRC